VFAVFHAPLPSSHHLRYGSSTSELDMRAFRPALSHASEIVTSEALMRSTVAGSSFPGRASTTSRKATKRTHHKPIDRNARALATASVRTRSCSQHLRYSHQPRPNATGRKRRPTSTSSPTSWWHVLPISSTGARLSGSMPMTCERALDVAKWKGVAAKQSMVR